MLFGKGLYKQPQVPNCLDDLISSFLSELFPKLLASALFIVYKSQFKTGR